MTVNWVRPLWHVLSATLGGLKLQTTGLLFRCQLAGIRRWGSKRRRWDL